MEKLESKTKDQTIENFFKSGWMASLVLMISVVLTCAAYWVARNLTYLEEKNRFEYRTEEIRLAIIERMRVYEQALYAGAAMMDSHGSNITRDHWKKFVAGLQINTNWPGIQGLGFAVPVEAEHKEVFEKRIQAEGFPDFKIRPLEEREEYTAIVYLEPFDWRNQRAFGFDMWSNDMRREAMRRAKEEGVAATSGIITLVQETDVDVQKGFLMYLPVYGESVDRKGSESFGAGEEKIFLGWVYSAFRANDLMKGILGEFDPSIGFEIYDGETIEESSLLFDTDKIYSQGEEKYDPIFFAKKSIVLQGRPWTLYLSTTSDYSINEQNRSSQYVLIGGFIINLLIFYLISSLFSINKKAQLLARDMTREYRLASEREEKASRAKSQFLANMSHELRTPLNSIIGFSYRLINRTADKLDEREMEGLNAIHRNGQSLLSLINDILDLTKVEAGKMEVNVEKFDLTDAISKNIIDWQGQAQEKNIKFSFEKPKTPIIMNSDSKKIQQIIRNLLSNAFKYTSEGSIVLSIKPKGNGENKVSRERVEISVADTGMGVSEEDMPDLFGSYFRAKEVRTQAIQGTGLGLVITSQLVTLLGGTMHVDSKIGEGSCFSVFIPATYLVAVDKNSEDV